MVINKKPALSDNFSLIKTLVVVTCTACFIYLAWYSYSTQVDNVKESDLPIIYAPKNIKFKPEDPGGFVVANKDKTIYDHISGKNPKTSAINTQKPTETPVAKEDVAALINKQLMKGQAR